MDTDGTAAVTAKGDGIYEQEEGDREPAAPSGCSESNMVDGMTAGFALLK